MLPKTECKLKRDFLDCSEIDKNDKKEPIEKILHKYEMEIRSHIKMENEFKKVAEEQEKKYNQISKELSKSKETYAKNL